MVASFCNATQEVYLANQSYLAALSGIGGLTNNTAVLK
ncbi:hypothetical protein HCH_04894 [Hahella chejuensis KCTC 2396]|uniref:Uncharacterized protein n=1 Tax=Hahella chejuensis (strain KCTC 2396) TaxID=349521 RepID=Q2SCN9_HAHCH|nr:hypothetical protein HCH_04894 [Hahella chejuensis KCTC 2396]